MVPKLAPSEDKRFYDMTRSRELPVSEERRPTSSSRIQMQVLWNDPQPLVHPQCGWNGLRKALLPNTA